MAEAQFEQIYDALLAAKSQEALELLSTLQRGLESVRTVPDTNPDQRGKQLTDGSTGSVALDTPQLREDVSGEFYGRLSICQGRGPVFSRLHR
jgi:hypothetical protein